MASSSAQQQYGESNSLIGKKQLLQWAAECSGGMDCHKYDDLRDGLVPLVLYRNLFPNGIPADYASSMRAQMSMTPLQRHVRQNWNMLQQLLRVAGIPANVWDRRAVAAAHPKACYNFLVMTYFLHKLRSGGDFSVDFALPIEPDLSNFLQSPRSLEVVNRAAMVRPVSAPTTSTSSSKNNVGRGGGAGGGNHTNSGYDTDQSADATGNMAGSSSADVTPTVTPRGGGGGRQTTTLLGQLYPGGGGPTPTHQQQQQQQQHSGDGDHQEFSSTIFVSPTPLSGSGAQHNNNNNSPPQQQRGGGVSSHNSSFNMMMTPTATSQQQKLAAQQSKRGGAGGAGAGAGAGGGWRFGTDTAHLGEAVIERLRAENEKLQDALSIAEEHSRATHQYCEQQIVFAREQFQAEVGKINTDAKLMRLQLEAEGVLSTTMVTAAAENKIRELERNIALEKKTAGWGSFADDPVPDEHSHAPREWLCAQLDSARRAMAVERQHCIALEQENLLLRDQVGKFMPLISKLQQEVADASDKVAQSTDVERVAATVDLSLRKVKDAASVEYQAKIATLQKEIESLRAGGGNSNNSNNDNRDEIYTLSEELARAKEQLERAEHSGALLRELLHKHCVSAVQRLDLSAFTLDAQAEDLGRGIVVHTSQLGNSTSTLGEAAAATYVNNIVDLVTRLEAASSTSSSSSSSPAVNISNNKNNIGKGEASAVETVRDLALKMAMLQQILEARVQTMANALRQAMNSLLQVEKDASQRQIHMQAEFVETQSRHDADIQRLNAAKATDISAIQSELQMARQQNAREAAEHAALIDRQAQAHQAMSTDLQSQVQSLRLGVAEVRRAESLLLQRDQMWSSLVDNLSLLASSSVSAEQRHRAEAKANQMREDLKRNAMDLKNNTTQKPHREVADAVREAVAHSQQQLTGCLDDLRAKQEEVKRLDQLYQSTVAELERERSTSSKLSDDLLLAKEQTRQAKDETASVQKQVADANSAVNHARELLETLTRNAVSYVNDVCVQLGVQARLAKPQQGGADHHQHQSLAGMIAGQRGLTATNNNNRSGSATDNNRTPSSSLTSQQQQQQLSSAPRPHAQAAAAAQKQAAEIPTSMPPSPPKLTAPKFSRIEMSPPKAPSASAAAASSQQADTKAAADSAINDFAKQQQAILQKYGIKS